MEFIPRFFRPPERGSFFLFGPRGTGKSLWAQTTLPTALRLDLLDPGETLKRGKVLCAPVEKFLGSLRPQEEISGTA